MKPSEHKCLDELIEKTGSDATFEKFFTFSPDMGSVFEGWGIYLYHYTPSLNISMNRGRMILNFCPICGEDLREET